MHDYLRAVGFSHIKQNKDVRELLKMIMSHPTAEFVASDKDVVFGEKVREFANRIGVGIRGEYDEDGIFHSGYYFPYFKGSQVSLNDEVSIEKHPEKDDYAGVCDHIRLGVSLIFQLLNMTDYMDYKEFHKSSIFQAPVCLSALSTSGKVLLPLMRTEASVQKTKESSRNRDRMIAAAREGDQEAIESLTLEDIDTYTEITRRLKQEDILTIVESYFMPFGIACDEYSILGDILSVEKVENSLTHEHVYMMTIECNELVFDVCMNEKDLMGEPVPGRRFKGVIWMQGMVDFNHL